MNKAHIQGGPSTAAITGAIFLIFEFRGDGPTPSTRFLGYGPGSNCTAFSLIWKLSSAYVAY